VERKTNSGVKRTGLTVQRLLASGVFAGDVPGNAEACKSGRLGPDIIALFPKEVGEFAYADLKKARTLKWFKPITGTDAFRTASGNSRKFLASAGVDPNSQVDELAWGLVAEGMTAKTEGTGSADVPTGEEIVGVAARDVQSEFDGSVL